MFRNRHFAFIFWLFVNSVSALPEVVSVGFLYEQKDRAMITAFRGAIEKINRDATLLPNVKLAPEAELLNSDDSFHASKKVCELLRSRSGVAAIFGPQLANTANHVQSICDAMEIPHIETRWDFKLARDKYSINLYPHPVSLGQAYYDVLKKLDWKTFVLLYDDSEGLIKMQSLLKETSWVCHVRQLEGSDWRPLLKKLKKEQMTKFVINVAEEKLKDLLKQAYQMGLMTEYNSYFITSLDLHLVDLEDYQYSRVNITTLRLFDPNSPEILQTVEKWTLREHQRYLTAGMDKMTTDAALMYDAVHLFAKALDEMASEGSEIDISVLYCESDNTWSHGSSLINYMKMYGNRRDLDNPRRNYPRGRENPMSVENGYNRRRVGSRRPRPPVRGGSSNFDNFPGSFDYDMYGGFMDFYNMTSRLYPDVSLDGFTGPIKFDSEGFRTDFVLQIVELSYKEGLKKVGEWTPAMKANYTRSYSEILEETIQSLKNTTLKVTTVIVAPYAMLKESSEKLTGNDRFEGFCIDIIDKVAEVIGFKYEIVIREDGIYGSYDPKKKKWFGMIGDLLEGNADLAIVDFTITYDREQIIDFSMPFMNLGIGIIYKKPSKKPPSLFSFMSPFSLDVWIYMATAYLGVSVLLFMLARISPSEWDNPHPCIQDPDELENAITLSNAFWFTIGSLMQQGSDIAPKALSTRIVAGIWWFFTLIMISSYTANLAAFLTVERMESPIEGAEDLAKQTKIKYGCKADGSTYGFFRESNIETYKRMWAAMSNARPTVFTSTNDEGVNRVSTSNGMYAFLMESVSIEYEIQRRCDLEQVGGLLDSKSYGIALPPDSKTTALISQAILKLKEKGIIQMLKTKWWERRKGGGRCVLNSSYTKNDALQEAPKTEDAAGSSTTAAELNLANVGGVFVVLLFGMGLSAVAAIFEFMWNARKLATVDHATFCEELGHEVRFILRCRGNTKAVRKSESAALDGPLFNYGENYNDTMYSYGSKK